MFITGFAAVTLNTTAKAVQDAQVLSKPFHLKDLVREIESLLGVGVRPCAPAKAGRQTQVCDAAFGSYGSPRTLLAVLALLSSGGAAVNP